MSAVKLRLPQIRVLTALRPGGALSRVRLAEVLGYTPVSGTVWRALNGLREGSSSGPPQPGLLQLGYVRSVTLDMDGDPEVCYQITDAGRLALELYDGSPPEPKPASTCTNKRYKENT